MKLMTKEIERRLPKLYSTAKQENPQIIVKFFCPWNQWTWFATEGEKQADGDWLFFGMVHGFEHELGNFTLSELESVTGPGGLKIERDMWFNGKTLKDVQ